MAAKEKLATILEAKSDPAKLAARLKAIQEIWNSSAKWERMLAERP